MGGVMSAGTAVRASVLELQAAGATPAGVGMGLDRQEVGQGSSRTAVQEVTHTMHIPVVSVVSLQHLLAFVRQSDGTLADDASGGSESSLLQRIAAYQDKYCIKE